MQDTFAENQGNLLIVDDLADNLRILSNTLLNHGYQVRAVKNGALALLGAKAAPPDVILLDIRMPEMDGYEVCRQLKSDPQLCEIPIIFLSALDEIEDKIKAFTVGGADYITKPFQTEEVLVRVKNQIIIQQLKKQVIKQEQQLEQITAALLSSAVPDGSHPVSHPVSHPDGNRHTLQNDERGNSANSEISETLNNRTQAKALSAITTILDYSDHLCQNPTIEPEQYAALQVIHQNGQILLNLVNTQLGSSIH
jgi:CheY-like chemotaxis protein